MCAVCCYLNKQVCVCVERGWCLQAVCSAGTGPLVSHWHHSTRFICRGSRRPARMNNWRAISRRRAWRLTSGFVFHTATTVETAVDVVSNISRVFTPLTSLWPHCGLSVALLLLLQSHFASPAASSRAPLTSAQLGWSEGLHRSVFIAVSVALCWLMGVIKVRL